MEYEKSWQAMKLGCIAMRVRERKGDRCDIKPRGVEAYTSMKFAIKGAFFLEQIICKNFVAQVVFIVQ